MINRDNQAIMPSSFSSQISQRAVLFLRLFRHLAAALGEPCRTIFPAGLPRMLIHIKNKHPFAAKKQAHKGRHGLEAHNAKDDPCCPRDGHCDRRRG
jgi:hypothetical protein